MKRLSAKIVVTTIVIVAAGAGYYGLSPLFKNIELDEAVPKNVVSDAKDNAALMPSGAEKLSPEEQEKMAKQVEEANKEPQPEMKEPMPADSPEEPAGAEKPKSYPVMGTFGHPASGEVRVLETTDGTVIRYEDFETINGPRLHVYLAKDLDADEYADLGPIRGTRGNINYSVPEGVNVSEYKYVMYWCVPFGVLFNYAEIR